MKKRVAQRYEKCKGECVHCMDTIGKDFNGTTQWCKVQTIIDKLYGIGKFIYLFIYFFVFCAQTLLQNGTSFKLKPDYTYDIYLVIDNTYTHFGNLIEANTHKIWTHI